MPASIYLVPSILHRAETERRVNICPRSQPTVRLRVLGSDLRARNVCSVADKCADRHFINVISLITQTRLHSWPNAFLSRVLFTTFADIRVPLNCFVRCGSGDCAILRKIFNFLETPCGASVSVTFHCIADCQMSGPCLNS